METILRLALQRVQVFFGNCPFGIVSLNFQSDNRFIGPRLIKRKPSDWESFPSRIISFCACDQRGKSCFRGRMRLTFTRRGITRRTRERCGCIGTSRHRQQCLRHVCRPDRRRRLPSGTRQRRQASIRWRERPVLSSIRLPVSWGITCWNSVRFSDLVPSIWREGCTATCLPFPKCPNS